MYEGAGDVAARPCKVRQLHHFQRDLHERHDNWGGARCTFGCQHCGPKGDDNVDLAVNQLGGKPRKAIPTSIGPPNGEYEVSALDEPSSLSALRNSFTRTYPAAPSIEDADPCDPTDTFTLLRARRQRPRRRAAEQRDDLPPGHSITSSARARSEEGTSRPSILAVSRLITNSYLVGACTAGRRASRLFNAIHVAGLARRYWSM